MRFLARLVHRSFRRVEQFADWLTGAAGPVFVALCLLLVGIGIWTFCEMQRGTRRLVPLLTTITFIAVATMFPFLAPTPPAVARLFETQSPLHIVFGLASAILEHPWLTARWVIAMQSCLFIVYNIGFHYYMAVHEPPGSVTNGLSDDLGERRIGPGSEVWWARHRSRAGKESILASRCENRYPLLRRVSESKRQISEEEVQRVQDSEDLWVNVKMCHKCPRIPLWKALACLPPELRLVEKQIRQSKQEAGSGGAGQVINGGSLAPSLVHAQSDFVDQAARGDTVEEIQAWLGSEANNLVPPPKPERTHHCSVCEVCILKFDHHCPWLNQCVGVGNERYFVLFMVWLSLGCFVVIFSGWRTVAKSVSFATWPYRYTPRIFPLLTYALCAIMGFALAIMAIWQILIIGWGETSVENSDNGHYREVCRRKGVEFTNVYDIGFVQNVFLFFNVGTYSSHSFWTLLAPWRMEPYSDGWHFSKMIGRRGRHSGLDPDDELTDDEVERDEGHPTAK